MENHLLWKTLEAVEQAELTFQETLRTLDDISQRYNLVAQRTIAGHSKKRQLIYERQIQAAITECDYPETGSSIPKKRRKHKKVNKRRPAVDHGLPNSKPSTKPRMMQTKCNFNFDNLNIEVNINTFDTLHRGNWVDRSEDGADKESCVCCVTHSTPSDSCKSHYFYSTE